MDPVLTQSDLPATPVYTRHFLRSVLTVPPLSQQVGQHCIQVNITLLSQHVTLSQQVPDFSVTIILSQQVPNFHMCYLSISADT